MKTILKLLSIKTLGPQFHDNSLRFSKKEPFFVFFQRLPMLVSSESKFLFYVLHPMQKEAHICSTLNIVISFYYC